MSKAKPMDRERRVAGYLRQNGNHILTYAQRRRMTAKEAKALSVSRSLWGKGRPTPRQRKRAPRA